MVCALLRRERRKQGVKAFQRPSTVRAVALRNSAISFAKVFSIGLKSGL